MDPNMPRLALFAQRDIQAGEELTFDYASSKTGSFILNELIRKLQQFVSNRLNYTENQDQKVAKPSDGEVTVKNECRCGAANCRKIMFSLPENQTVTPFRKTE